MGEKIRIEKRELASEFESLLKSIKFQHSRIAGQHKKIFASLQKKSYKKTNNWMSHDADYYFILSRRVFRFIELLAQKESKVANLKGKNKELFSKLKIRDYSEHWVGWSKFPSISPGSMLKISMGFNLSKEGIVLQSGDLKWDFIKDHKLLVTLLGEVQEILEESTIEEYLFEKTDRTYHNLISKFAKSLKSFFDNGF